MSSRLTQLSRICGLLYGTRRTSYEVQREVYKLTGKRMSESAVTARFRELRTKGWNVVSELVEVKRNGSQIWEYGIPIIPRRKK
jgi:hypothetical protein